MVRANPDTIPGFARWSALLGARNNPATVNELTTDEDERVLPPLPRTEQRQYRRTEHQADDAYDVWLGVGLRVEAASPGEATRRAIVWLRAILESAPEQDGLQVTAPALDLLEPVVRAIQQMGSQKRGDARAHPHEHAPEHAQDGTGP